MTELHYFLKLMDMTRSGAGQRMQGCYYQLICVREGGFTFPCVVCTSGDSINHVGSQIVADLHWPTR